MWSLDWHLALVNSFDDLIGSLICYSVDLTLLTPIGTMVVPLLGNYFGRSLESFLVFLLYLYIFRL